MPEPKYSIGTGLNSRWRRQRRRKPHPGTLHLAAGTMAIMAPTAYMTIDLVGLAKAARGKTPTDVWWQTIVSPNGKDKERHDGRGSDL